LNILVLRFSAIGDVAMTVPVVDSLARQYPENIYTVVSQSFLHSLFENCPENVHFVGVNLENEYKGAPGMYRLYRELSKLEIDAVADLHDVLRTKLLRFFFCCSGLKVRHINKGRKEKRSLTRKKDKIFRQLKPTTERYTDVFSALGQTLSTLDFRSIFGASRGKFDRIVQFTGIKSGFWIGIAPFAKHKCKMLPLNCMKQVVAYFAGKEDVNVFLFGGGMLEKAILDEWSNEYPKTMTVTGKLTMSAELILMSHLDVMVSMDSANMHLASLTATPVVSVWGATHPYLGFYGYKQSPENAVQVELDCRPCSVYGNKPCHRNNPVCMNEITAQMLIDKINLKKS